MRNVQKKLLCLLLMMILLLSSFPLAARASALDADAYEGKTIACVGDSITAGVGATKGENDYVTLLAQQLGMEYINLGASGTTLCTGGHRTCNIGQLTEAKLQGADVVTIAMGINDWDQAKAGYYSLGDITSTDTSTIYGAARMWCERIEELKKTDSLKDTEFYFLTPVITSWNDSVSSVRNWDQSKTNVHGYTLRDLCNAIGEVCGEYEIPVIDMNLISGMYYVSAEDNNVAEFGGDGVHPGPKGHEMIANALAKALLHSELREDHDHAWGSWITTSYPTCQGGTEQRVCSVCTATESRTLEPGDKHSYTSVVTAPTCTEAGYVTNVCTVCGDSQPTTQTTDITDRFQWKEGYVISATGGGMSADKNWVASDYVDISAFETIEIVTGDTVNANTTLGIAFYNANKQYISGVVHTDKTGTEYGILVHNLTVPENAVYLRSTWYSVNHGSYAGATLHTFYCKGSGSGIPPLGHSYALTDSTVPTCTSQGAEVYTCTACGDSYTETLKRQEHSYDNGVCTVCSTSILGGDWLAPNFAQGDYTMVVVPDTQILVESWPEIYDKQMQWIADNRDALNIQAVLHMGDMVNNNNDAQWTLCEAGTDKLEAAGIPWMPMRGNHDDSAWFNKYYDYATYGTDQSWFGGSYHADKLDHTYWFVTVGQKEYLILSLGWAPSWEVLDWAKAVVDDHSDKSVILVDHAYMNSDGTLLSQGDAHCVSSYHAGYPNGDDVWNAFKDCGNVILAMGGHIHSADVVTYVDKNGAGRDVTSLLFDRQNDDISNRYAMVALLTFHEDSETVDINWYSIRYDALYRQKNQFSIEVPDVCTHSYLSETVEATCTESGGTRYTCDLCGHVYWGNQIAALGHSFKNNRCANCGLLRIDMTGQFTDWTEGGPVLYRNGYGYGEEGYPDGANPNLKYSDYISVEGMDTLELTVCARKGNTPTGGYAFYTDKGVEYFISEGASSRNGNGAAAEGTVVHTIEIPEDAKYIRVSYWVENTSYYAAVPFSCVGYKMSCSHSYENGTCTLCGAAQWDTDGDGVLEVLAIGNSFSVDALEYFWQIADDLGIGEIVVGDLYIGGCTLETHAANAAGDLAKYTYYYNDNGTWTTTSSYKISTALESRSWDYISMQQASNYSGVESTYNENLTELIAYVQARSDAKLVWHMTWAYQQDSTHSAFPTYGSDQMTMYNAIVSAVQNQIVTNGNFDLIVPSGTAVQNSRTSLLGDTTTRDGYHMSKDYGRYLTGLMWFKTLTGLPVDAITYAPSGVDAEEKAIAIESVNNAAAKPFAVTKSEFTNEIPEDYLLLAPELYKGAFWHSTYAEGYNVLHDNKSNSHQFFATPRFTREDLPVGSIIVVENGWQYRPEGWVTDALQTEREDTTTRAFVRVTEEWWGDYTIRAFNISKVGLPSLADVEEEEVRAAFRIYVPEEKHVHNYQGTSCTLCGGEHPNLANYKGKVISILSASTSTFAGWIPEADGFNLAHRARYPQDNLFTEVEHTWWHQLITQLDAKLGINDSWAGSQVLNTQDTNSGDLGPDAAMASLTRIQNLGANGIPDIILFFGAGNDMGRGVPLGSFDPATAPTEADLTAYKWDNLADAYTAAILRLKHFYPDSRIVVMTTYPMPSYVTEAKLDKYGPVLQAICDHYGIERVSLRDCGVTFDMLPDNIHPNAEGMDHITQAVLDYLLEQDSMEPGENVVCSVKHDLTNARAGKHYYKGISAGTAFEETITGDGLTVTVTMGGVDITASAYADGKLRIENVTGDIVITAKGAFNADGHLQQLPENVCCGTNLWTALEPENIYYTVDGWGNTTAGTSWSITFPVKAGDQIWATSLGAYPENGSTANGVRVTWFDENGVLATLDRNVVYEEFAEHGYITAPAGAVALNVPMTGNQDHYAVYLLSTEHAYEAIVTAPTCTEKGYTTHTCTTCGDSYVDSYVDARGYDWMLEDGEFNLLLIGNSFSEDASNCGQGMKTSQLLDILQSMLGEDVSVTVGLCYSGGKGLNWHATQSEQGNRNHSLRVISTEDGTWKSLGACTSADALTWADWDVVSLQHYEINTTTGKESNAYPDQVDPKFDNLEAAAEFMLDHVNRYAPNAAVYFYMHWSRAYNPRLNESLATYNKMADFFPVVLDYAGAESNRRFETIIPVGLSVQNARTTYLAKLAYNTTAYADKNLNLTTDAQIGLQRDGGHLSFNIGRYIAALTFAETILPQQLRQADYVLPDIRITESIGQLPKEYTTLAQRAVAAAVDSWLGSGSLAVTPIEGYTEDPTVAEAARLAQLTLDISCAADAEMLEQKILEAARSLVSEDFNVDKAVLPEDFVLNGENQQTTVTLTVRFGYTSVTVEMPLTISAHSYESVITAPTCTEKGYTTHTCTACGHSFVDSETEATGHSYGQWQEVTAAMEIREGEERRTCHCGEYESRATVPLGYVSATAETLEAGQTLTLMSNNIVMTNKDMYFRCELDTLAGGLIRMGHGKTAYTSQYIEITETHLNVWYYYKADNNKCSSYAHGLEIKDWLEVRIHKGTGNNATVSIATEGGTFSGSYNWYSGSNGPIYCETEGVALENVDCRWWAESLASDYWFFGDSWFSTSGTDRWTSYMLKDGHTDVLMGAYGGMGAATAAAQFTEFLKYDAPKYAIWCMGMNNGDRNGVINSSWLTSTETFLALCEEYDITPILATIPTTPKVNNRLKNAWVEESGYRYIDFDLAVVENHVTGQWFEGTAASDLNHPSVAGAKLLYPQVHADFPELAEGNRSGCSHKLTELGARTPECVDGGRLAYYVCTLCAATFADAEGTTPVTTAQMLLPPKGHSYEYAVETAPTLTAAGKLKGICAVCSGTTSVELPKLDEVAYDYAVTAEPSYTETGLATYTWKDTTYGTYTFEVVLEVLPILYGDVNGDGTVNNKDRLVLTRYLAKWTDYPEEIINMAAADVNGDGKVNNLDRLILTRHLAKWTGYEELPYKQ